MNRPDKIPAIAGTPVLPTSVRYEPAGSTASSGFPALDTLPARSYNWIGYYVAQWLRFHEEQAVQLGELCEFATATAYRISASPLNFSPGGPLTQGPTTDSVYYSEYGRIRFRPGITQFTFPAASTVYVHARPQPDPTLRDVEPDYVIDAAPAVLGYAALCAVTTDATTVVSVTDVSGAGIICPSPWLFRDSVSIAQTYSSGPSALAVDWPSSGVTAGVTLIAQPGAIRDGLRVQINDGGVADGRVATVDAWTTFPALTVVQAGTGEGAVLTAPGDVVVATTTSGAALKGQVADATAAAVVADATGAAGADAIVLEPLAFAPSPGRAGGLWIVAGLGAYALQYRLLAAGVLRYAHASQDAIRVTQAFTSASTSVGPATGPVTLQTLTVWCYSGGTYEIAYEYFGGRTQGSTCIPQIDCRVAGATIPGAGLAVFDHPNPNNVGGPYTTCTYHRTYRYTHGGADGFVTFDMRTTTTAGAGTTSYASRGIYWRVVES